MLAGNRLRDLPEGLREAPNLELIRISANRFEALPPWLVTMPSLAWLAWSGNPLDAASDAPAARAFPWAGLLLGGLLGQGASGKVHAAAWHADNGVREELAISCSRGS